MKYRNFILSGLTSVMLLATGSFSGVLAQQGRGGFRGQGRPMNQRPMERLKLTDDQQKQMSELRARFHGETLHLKNLINEKQAHLKTLVDTDKRDMKDLDKTIEELSALKGDLLKKGIAHHDAVKKILTPDQMKIWEIRAKQNMREGPGGPRNHRMRGGKNPTE